MQFDRWSSPQRIHIFYKNFLFFLFLQNLNMFFNVLKGIQNCQHKAENKKKKKKKQEEIMERARLIPLTAGRKTAYNTWRIIVAATCVYLYDTNHCTPPFRQFSASFIVVWPILLLKLLNGNGIAIKPLFNRKERRRATQKKWHSFELPVKWT